MTKKEKKGKDYDRVRSNKDVLCDEEVTINGMRGYVLKGDEDIDDDDDGDMVYDPNTGGFIYIP